LRKSAKSGSADDGDGAEIDLNGDLWGIAGGISHSLFLRSFNGEGLRAALEAVVGKVLKLPPCLFL